MRREEGSDRKVRTDKKKEVKPTVSGYVKKDLYKYASIIDVPVKDAAEKLVEVGLKSDTILLLFQPSMVSNFYMGNRIIMGNNEYPVTIRYRGLTSKVSIKFQQGTYEELRKLAFALSHTPTTTCALIIRKTLYNFDFMEDFIHGHLKYLTKEQRKELELHLKRIRNNVRKLSD